MDWLTLLSALFPIMGAVSGGFLAYGSWLCLRQLMSDRTPLQPDHTRGSSNWPHPLHAG